MSVLHPVVESPEVDSAPVRQLTGILPRAGASSKWASPELADESAAAYRIRLLSAFGLLGLISFADLLLVKTTFNVILRDAEWLSWVLGVSLTLAAVAMAFFAGRYSRQAVAGGPSVKSDQAIVGILIVLWLVLGAGIFLLRWNAAEFAPAQVAYEGAQTTSVEEAKERLLAVVLAAVYLATGGLAFVDGYRLTNPVAAAMRTARGRLEKLRPRLQERIGVVARLRENLTAAELEYARLPEQLAEAIAARETLAEELKALARVQIAMHLGDPSATGVVRPDSRLRAVTGPAEPEGVGAVGDEGLR